MAAGIVDEEIFTETVSLREAILFATLSSFDAVIVQDAKAEEEARRQVSPYDCNLRFVLFSKVWLHRRILLQLRRSLQMALIQTPTMILTSKHMLHLYLKHRIFSDSVRLTELPLRAGLNGPQPSQRQQESPRSSVSGLSAGGQPQFCCCYAVLTQRVQSRGSITETKCSQSG